MASDSALVMARRPSNRNRKGNHDGVLISSDERANAALKLRKEGRSFPEIAQELSISTETAHRLVTKDWAALIRDNIEVKESLVADQLSVLEEMETRIMPNIRIAEPDLESVDRILKIMARKASLLGLDKVEKKIPELKTPTISAEVLTAIALAVVKERRVNAREV